MLESVRTLIDVPPGEGGRFAREDIIAARQRRLLLEQAQRRASQMVADASAEVDSIRSYAFQEGYSQGVVSATSRLSDLLIQSRDITRQLRSGLTQAASQLLRDVLQRDEWLDQAVLQWLADQEEQESATLHLLLPQRCKPQTCADARTHFAQRLGEHWTGAVSIEYHHQERYVLRLADQVLEFDLESTQAQLTPRLLAQLNELSPGIRSLNQQAAQVVYDLSMHTLEQLAGYNAQANAPDEVTGDQPNDD